MKTVIDYLRLCLFLGSALIGVQVPSFVEQYGQRLQSHTSESELSLNKFKTDAERFFKGDIKQLIEHYKTSKDKVFIKGGENISSIYQRNTMLNESLLQFNKSTLSPYQAAFLSPIKDIRDEAWNSYDHSIRLNQASIIWALVLAFIFTALCELVINILLRSLALTTAFGLGAKQAVRPARVDKNSPPTM